MTWVGTDHLDDKPRLNAVELVGDLFAHLMNGSPLSTATRDALARSIVVAVRDGVSLDRAFGIAIAGQRSLRTQLLQIRRDKALMDAVRAVSCDDADSDWSRCCRLAPLLRRFVTDTWPIVRRMGDPPHDWPEWKRAAFMAQRIGLSLPNSPRGLYDVVQRVARYSSQKEGAILLAHYV